MKEYKAIFSDIDGTLLTSKHEVSKETKECLKKLKERKTPFILVSARMPKSINKIRKEIEIDSPIICYSGGLIVDNNKYIFDIGIDISKAVEIKKYINKNWNDISISCYSYDNWIVDKIENKWVNEEMNITQIKPIEGNIINICGNKEGIHKILCIGNKDDIEEIRKKLIKEYKDLSIYKSKDNYLEIMSKQVSKSKAIEFLCNEMDINIKDIIAIGDNFNDADMIKTAGKGIAMGNAPDDVKVISNEITDTNDNDGVAKIIEKYFLK